MNSGCEKSKNLSALVIETLRSGKKIHAIKLLREEENLNLKEAKEVIDQYIQSNTTLQKKMALEPSEAARNILFVSITGLLLLIWHFYF